MAAYNPDQDVIVEELLEVRTTPTEVTKVRVRRYDAADGTPGTTKKLEVSRWRVLVSGDLKPKAGVRLTQTEAAAILAALLELPLANISIDDDWNVALK